MTAVAPQLEVNVHVAIVLATKGTVVAVGEGLAGIEFVGEGLAVSAAVGVADELDPIESVGVEVAVIEGVREGVGVGVTGVPVKTTPLNLKVPLVPLAAVLGPSAKQKLL